jgi:hypothetical protein
MHLSILLHTDSTANQTTQQGAVSETSHRNPHVTCADNSTRNYNNIHAVATTAAQQNFNWYIFMNF